MIGRIWHGWTRPENADRYERLLKEEIFPGIAEKDVPRYRGIQLFRRPIGPPTALAARVFASLPYEVFFRRLDETIRKGGATWSS